jgi:hypothetical protein
MQQTREKRIFAYNVLPWTGTAPDRLDDGRIHLIGHCGGAFRDVGECALEQSVQMEN